MEEKKIEQAAELIKEAGKESNSVGVKTICVCALAAYGTIDLGIKAVKGIKNIVKKASAKKAENNASDVADDYSNESEEE